MLGGVCQPRQEPGQPLPPSAGPGRYAVSKVRLALSLATASLWYRRKVLALVCLTLTLSVTLLLGIRSEEHTSELQSRPHLVCRLLLEKNKSPDNSHNLLRSS